MSGRGRSTGSNVIAFPFKEQVFYLDVAGYWKATAFSFWVFTRWMIMIAVAVYLVLTLGYRMNHQLGVNGSFEVSLIISAFIGLIGALEVTHFVKGPLRYFLDACKRSRSYYYMLSRAGLSCHERGSGVIISRTELFEMFNQKDGGLCVISNVPVSFSVDGLDTLYFSSADQVRFSKSAFEYRLENDMSLLESQYGDGFVSRKWVQDGLWGYEYTWVNLMDRKPLRDLVGYKTGR